jgi:lipoyl(octanoyl) transferase
LVAETEIFKGIGEYTNRPAAPQSSFRGKVRPVKLSRAGGRLIEKPMHDLTTRWLGRLAYEEALALQEELVRAKIADPTLADELLLLEHEPVYTIGRTPDQSSLRDAAALPHPLVRINRGGQATYHGPGQLVGYPIVDLRRRGQDLHVYLRGLEEALIVALEEIGIAAQRREGLTGVWVGERKIASIGVGVRKWVAMHGFALNVGRDLDAFQQITPCGIAGVEMTSVERETGQPCAVEAMADVVAGPLSARLQAMVCEPLSPRASSANLSA